MIRVERHPLGPRLYVLDRRLHECHLGLALLALAGLAWAAGRGPAHLASALGAVGGWLLLKDWRDLFSTTRDTGVWSPWIHRPRATLRRVRRGAWLPRALGALTAAVAVAKAAPVLAPDLAARVGLLGDFEPADLVPVAHVLALPAGLALLAIARQLARRRRDAWALAVALLAALGTIDVLRGLWPAGAAGLGLVCLLVWGREAFCVPAFAPPPARSPADAAARRTARRLVERHGADTLSFFKLRRDLSYLFSPDGQAFLGYRVEGRQLLVSADPVGREAAIPDLMRELFSFAEVRGLRVAIVGASARRLHVYREGGLHAFYVGDEALVDVRSFSLEGRAIRKVRQSVTRAERAGYRAELRPIETLAPGELDELEAVSERWRAGAPERGFSMAMDTLGGGEQRGSVVVVARDAEGRARGFLHLVPCPGRPAMSLSMMRRDRTTPNGLTEFLVVRAIQELRARGARELSLNFASFARLLREPRGRRERMLGRAVGLADRHFQVGRLYRFNAKFSPRWEPRYLLYEGALGLPRAGLAALWAEGQVPRPRVPWPRAAGQPR